MTSAATWQFPCCVRAHRRNWQSHRFFNNKYMCMNKFTNMILLLEIQPFLSVYFNGERTGSGYLIKTWQKCCLFFLSVTEEGLSCHTAFCHA